MTPMPHGGLPNVAELRLPAGFDPCWVGPSFNGEGFCFGSTTGQIMVTSEDGKPLLPPVNVSPSGEAINGVVRSGNWLAVSTRAEVVFRKLSANHDGVNQDTFFLHNGTHGIAATRSGSFVAPMGPKGIMVQPADRTGKVPAGFLSPAMSKLYFYRMLTLPERDGQDLLVAAVRTGGLAAIEILGSDGSYTMHRANFPALDVIDACLLDQETHAVVVLGLDGTLVLFQDAFKMANPRTVRFDTIQGTAYRVLSSGGDIFVVTSKAIYCLVGLGRMFLDGQTGPGFSVEILVIDLAAADAEIVGKWMVVVGADSVYRFDITNLEALAPGDRHRTVPRDVSPQWDIHDEVTRQQLLIPA